MDLNTRPDLKGNHRVKWLSWPYCLGLFSILFATAFCFADLSGSLDEKQILLRLQPEGQVTVEAGGKVVEQKPAVALNPGQKRYEDTCHICHGPGLAGAPKFGDKDEWAPRIAEGMDTLLQHAIHGYKAMPPKGTCMSCSDDEIKEAIEYMISHSK